ncbi:MAG: ABC transporter ATP-binding protein [Gammaproteobacteria bacterium]|nr:ABC transporter ATP-binding protein [Gammaproteobacteria bacterium]
MNQLELRDITLQQGGKTIVSDVNLSLEAGEIGCLLGPSGCGKTTLLKCIAGFLPQQSGEVVIRNQVIRRGHRFPPEKRQVGMVFQDLALFPHLSVADNIGFGLKSLSKLKRTYRIEQLLRLVGMSKYKDAFPHELSGGEQQRIALIRAMAPAPALLLMDEPFSSQDTDRRERLSMEVRDVLKKEGMTALLVTHDQTEAFAISDKMGLLAQGVLHQWGLSYDLYHEPHSPFVANFIGKGVLLRGRVVNERTLQTPLGYVSGEFSRQYSAGFNVRLLVRPDDIIHDDEAAKTAKVVKKTFQGATFLYTLALLGGDQVLCLASSHHDHEVGEEIGVRLEMDHLVVFDAGG